MEDKELKELMENMETHLEIIEDMTDTLDSTMNDIARAKEELLDIVKEIKDSI